MAENDEVPDLYEMTPEERAKFLSKKTRMKHDYVPMQPTEEEEVDPNLLDALEKEALELIIEHLKRIR